MCANRNSMKIASSFWLRYDYCLLSLCCLWRVYIYCLVWKATPTCDGFSTWSDVQKATWSCFDQNPSHRRSINSVMSVLLCHISLLFVFGEKNFFKLLPQNTEQDSLHTIGQNLGFQTSEHEPLDTWFCNDITENLDICQLFWVGLLVHLHHTDWVGASVRYGRGAESQDGTTSQLLELCILLRDLFTQEIVSGEPTVKSRTKRNKRSSVGGDTGEIKEWEGMSFLSKNNDADQKPLHRHQVAGLSLTGSVPQKLLKRQQWIHCTRWVVPPPWSYQWQPRISRSLAWLFWPCQWAWGKYERGQQQHWRPWFSVLHSNLWWIRGCSRQSRPRYWQQYLRIDWVALATRLVRHPKINPPNETFCEFLPFLFVADCCSSDKTPLTL